MGLLNDTRCTVIGHMQYADGRGVREEVSEDLDRMGIKLFDHYKQPFIMDVNDFIR